MQDLIDHVCAAAALEPDTAAKAIGIVFDAVQKGVPPDTAAPLIDGIPGARLAAAGAAEDEAEGGGGGGLAARLEAEGVDEGAMAALKRALFARLRARLGDTPVDAVLRSMPDLAGVA